MKYTGQMHYRFHNRQLKFFVVDQNAQRKDNVIAYKSRVVIAFNDGQGR